MSCASFSSPIACALVAAGGALGSLARYLVGEALAGLTGADGFPWALLTINTAGSLGMGLLFGWFYAHGGGTETQRLLLGVGLLGGFTTFSAFSLETLLLIERGASALAFGFIAASVIAGVAALYLGLMITGPSR